MLRIMAQPEMQTCGVFRNGPTQQYSVYSQKKHRAVRGCTLFTIYFRIFRVKMLY